jgi:hypothetical protein
MALNPKQEKFCQLWVESGNATQSYMEAAGTGARVAATLGWRWLRKADIQDRIAEIQGEVRELASLNKAEIVDLLVRCIETPASEVTGDSDLCVGIEPDKIKIMDKAGAIKELNRMCGHYAPDKVEVSAESEMIAMIRGITGAKDEG